MNNYEKLAGIILQMTKYGVLALMALMITWALGMSLVSKELGVTVLVLELALCTGYGAFRE